MLLFIFIYIYTIYVYIIYIHMIIIYMMMSIEGREGDDRPEEANK